MLMLGRKACVNMLGEQLLNNILEYGDIPTTIIMQQGMYDILNKCFVLDFTPIELYREDGTTKVLFGKFFGIDVEITNRHITFEFYKEYSIYDEL